jgi:DNA-binding protein H-NS
VNIYEALEQAAALREQADELRRQADELEIEWVGAASGDVLTVQRLVDVVRKIGEAG